MVPEPQLLNLGIAGPSSAGLVQEPFWVPITVRGTPTVGEVVSSAVAGLALWMLLQVGGHKLGGGKPGPAGIAAQPSPMPAVDHLSCPRSIATGA